MQTCYATSTIVRCMLFECFKSVLSNVGLGYCVTTTLSNWNHFFFLSLQHSVCLHGWHSIWMDKRRKGESYALSTVFFRLLLLSPCPKYRLRRMGLAILNHLKHRKTILWCSIEIKDFQVWFSTMNFLFPYWILSIDEFFLLFFI